MKAKQFIALAALAALIITATGCGRGGHSGGCGAYGNPKAPNNHMERLAE